MKRILMVMIALVGLSGLVMAANNNYTVALSTFTIATYDACQSLPHVSGGVQFKKVLLANSGDTAQTVTFYENATSTTAASEFMTVVVASTGTTVIDFETRWTGRNVAECNNLAVKKSATGSTVTMTLFYK